MTATAISSAEVAAAWTTPVAPFRIAGNLYYVGSQDLAAYLVVTPEGDVLINSNLQSSVGQIRHSVEALGFHFSDIKVLLISHAHFDHAAGSAAIKRLTGAKYAVMDADVRTVETGGAADPLYGKGGTHYPPAQVDRVLRDGDTVRLGNTVLVAHKTAGHTPGCTTWTMEVDDGGHLRNVVIVGSWSVLSEMRLVPGLRGAGRQRLPATYPGIAADFAHTFALLDRLPCDIFLGAHGSYFNMRGKLQQASAGAQDVWVDPQGYRAELAARARLFREALAHQQQQADREHAAQARAHRR